MIKKIYNYYPDNDPVINTLMIAVDNVFSFNIILPILMISIRNIEIYDPSITHQIRIFLPIFPYSLKQQNSTVK